MSLAPLTPTFPQSFPVSQGDMLPVRSVGEITDGQAQPFLTDLPDFADFMAQIDKVAPSATHATETGSASEATARPESEIPLRPASEKDEAESETYLPESQTAGVDDPATLAESATGPETDSSDIFIGDTVSLRPPVFQLIPRAAESVQAASWHQNVDETADSETLVHRPDSPAEYLHVSGVPFDIVKPLGGDQDPGADFALFAPVDKTIQNGGGTKVSSASMSLQEFTIVASAARSPIAPMTRDGRDVPAGSAGVPESTPALGWGRIAVPAGSGASFSGGGFWQDAPVNPKSAATAEPGDVPAGLLPRRAVEQVLVRPDPAFSGVTKAIPSAEAPAAQIPLSVAAERQTSSPGSAQTHAAVVAGAAAGPAPLPTSPGRVAADPVMLSSVPLNPSLPGRVDQTRPKTEVPFATTQGSRNATPVPMKAEIVTRNAWRTESQTSPTQGETVSAAPEKTLVNTPKVPVSVPPRVQGAQEMVPLAMNHAGHAFAIMEGFFDKKTTEDAAEFTTISPIGTSTALPRPEAGMPRLDLPRHVAQQIADVATRAADGPVDLHLNPAELGKVRISMAMAEGGIAVNILAERPETLDLMRRHIDQLAQEFRHLGYGTINFSFGQQKQGQENRQDGGHAATPSSASGDRVAAAPATRAGRQDSGLDIRI
ncbi:flagellar hook-length control protein FliK [Seohaeicola saemankumensis]|uniref:Flagellar hook-length control protein FliK n=1 Tax=Seohaeicola saemankumensis TaxID=481181 RepID=A0ABW3TET8_9RHOB